MKRPSFAQIAALNAAIMGASYAPDFNAGAPNMITAINAALMTEQNFQQPLTTYATGWRDADLTAELALLAPSVQVSDRFEYSKATNVEEFFADTDDARAPRGEFKTVEYTETKVQAKTYNRGLQVIVEKKELLNGGAEKLTGKLMRRILRNKLRRAVALYLANATNVAKTWDTTAGKDPDQDIMTTLITAANKSGLRPNRVAFGDTAFSKRALAHRAQTTAGGFASASMSLEQIAAILGVDQVGISKARYSDAATTKAEVLSNIVLLFYAIEQMDTEDGSNIKDFYSPCDASGSQFAVYQWDVGAKMAGLAVEHNELMALTSTLGLYKMTIS